MFDEILPASITSETKERDTIGCPEADVAVVVVAPSMRRGWRRKAMDTYSHNDVGLGNLQVYNVADAVPKDFLGQLDGLSA